MKASPIAVSVSREIAAPPRHVYDLISDVPQMSRYSPETVETRWLDGATTATVGARFRGVNALGSTRWVTKPTVTAATPGRLFAFRVPSGARSTWTYQLDPTDVGTLVTESLVTERPMPAFVRFLIRRAGVQDRTEHLRGGMSTTLDRLSEAAVSAESAPAHH
jgi:uncharacterized protein YndB with AHSA1/START domain